MKKAKLQSKLFRAYLFLACLVLFSFAIFFLVFVSRQQTNSQIQAMNTLNDSFQNQVDAALKSLDMVSANINYSNMSKDTLDSSFNLNISYDMLEEMADLFISISGTELKADQVNLYDFSGNVLQAGMSTMVKKAADDQIAWAEQAQALAGTKLITPPYRTDAYSKSTKSRQWFISLYRTFYNQYGRSVGTIETVKQCKSIFKSIISYEKKNRDHAASIYIFDKNENLVYPYDVTAEEAAEMQKYFGAAMDSGEPFLSPVTLNREYAARTISTYSGYTYLTVQPESVILSPVYDLLKVLLAVVTLFLCISALISYRLSRSLVKPIKHLKHIIQRMELDTLGQEKATSYPVSVNELDELYQAFQNMSDNLKDSMNLLIEAQEQELKSRTLALQSQINPHFYYNSLSSIIVLAENGDSDVVIKMCRNLSNIMRYITDTSTTTVTLRQEIDYVKKYLYCMKVRYQSSLNYDILIDESLMDEKVPKLLIQPIVENAIKYGSDCQPPWYITIQSSITEDRWQIDVIDSGNGFSPEAIDKITRNIQDALKNPGMPALKINGLGTLNVYLRWKLFCKDDIIFTYGNTPEGHGIVSIGRYFPKDAENGEKL
ncbi:MAG: histidine kinase [Eubacteriales bacterium]|nr:histidine kinase [Eubacteriales bacterium]